jgi:uncharacterized protein YjbI with pentapeptide repeats
MKRKRYLLVGLVLGGVIGWTLGFLRLPYIEKNCSFLLGFIAALAFVSLGLILPAAWNGSFLPGLIGKKTATEDSKSARTRTFVWSVLVGVLLLGGIVNGFMLYRRDESFNLQIQTQDKKMEEMKAMLASLTKSDLEPLLHSMLEDIDKELKRNPGRTLSDSTIDRIATLSFAFKPFNYIKDDSLSKQACSPERGQLLQALVLMNIDSGTFTRIKRNTLFAWADLRKKDLRGFDLSGINLMEANLDGADLSGTNLKGADMREANLWGANLNRADLSGTDLKRADLRWAQLNEANLTLANLNGANLSNAQLIKADLTGASFQRAQSAGALLNQAILTNAGLAGTNLSKANLRQAELTETDLRSVNLSEADVVGVTINRTIVSKNWPDKMKEWQPMGMKELQELYTVVNDTADKFKSPLYRLKKNK